MTKRSILVVLGLAMAIIVAAPSKANAGVVVGVRIGPVYPRPAYVVVYPRPVVYRYYPRPYVFAPAYVRPVPGYYYRGRWRPRPPYVVYRSYVGPRYYHYYRRY